MATGQVIATGGNHLRSKIINANRYYKVPEVFQYGIVEYYDVSTRNIIYTSLKDNIVLSKKGAAIPFHADVVRFLNKGDIVPLVIGPVQQITILNSQYETSLYYLEPVNINNSLQDFSVDVVSINVIQEDFKKTNVQTDVSSEEDVSSTSISDNVDDYLLIAAKFIAANEGFTAHAYFDENAYRAGYGSDYKYIRGKGEVKVDSNTTFTKQEAWETLLYRLKYDFQPDVINALKINGVDYWSKLNSYQKATLLDIAYNTGSGFLYLKGNSFGSIIRQGIINGDIDTVIRGIRNSPTRGAVTKKFYSSLEKRVNQRIKLYLGKLDDFLYQIIK